MEHKFKETAITNQNKRKARKKLHLIQLNVKVRNKESEKAVQYCNKYIVTHVMNIEQILQYHSFMNLYKWKEDGL